MKINPRCINDLNVKYEAIKILSGEYLYNLRVGKVFLNMQQKAGTIKIKVHEFVHIKNLNLSVA